MTKRPDKFRKLSMKALSIANTYVDAYSAFLFMKEILQLQKDNLQIFISYSEYFNLLYLLSRNSMILGLSNILIDNKDSITLYDFRSFLVNNFSTELSDTCCHDSDILLSINSILDTYSDDSDLINELKNTRDKYIAHIDKSAFHSPKIPEHQLSIDEFQSAFTALGSFIGHSIDMLGINPELINFSQFDRANVQFRLIIDKLYLDL